MYLKTVELLRWDQEEGLEILQRDLNIQITQSQKNPNLFLFKYGIESPFSDPLVQECRGLILDKDNNWNPVCVPYFKFFNYSEGNAAEINWETATVYEKLDGSLMTLYYYNGEWCVSSSGNPDAAGNVGDTNLTFADLFWQTFNNLKYELPWNKDLCYMFELMTTYNQVVVQHKESKLVLHGMRNVITGEEYLPSSHWVAHNYQVPLQYVFGSDTGLNYILGEASKFNGSEHEGFVVVDRNFNRIKIKAPDYLAKHRLRSSINIRSLVDIVRMGEDGEVVSYFPEYEKILTEISQKIEQLVEEVQSYYNQHKDLESQKDFALQVCSHKCSGMMFTMRKFGKTAKEVLLELPVAKVVDLLDISLKENVDVSEN